MQFSLSLNAGNARQLAASLVKKLSSYVKFRRFGRAQISGGTSPVNRLLATSTCFKLTISEIVSGRVPAS